MDTFPFLCHLYTQKYTSIHFILNGSVQTTFFRYTEQVQPAA